MGMYCACGVKKRGDWKCECDWNGWFLGFEMEHEKQWANIPIKEHPEKEGTYYVRTFSDGDYDEEESEFCLIPKNWGELTNQAISRWKITYDDNWMGYKGVYAWKELPVMEVHNA